MRLLILSIAVTLGCQAADPEHSCLAEQNPNRLAQIQSFLQVDNAVWLSEEHALLRDKLCTMAGAIDICREHAKDRIHVELFAASNPYPFMRGSVGLFLADIMRRGRTRQETDFLRTPGSTQVLLVGDPHPENLGTVFRTADTFDVHPLSKDDLRLGWFDFDASTYGPYTTDLRRASVGLWAFVHNAHGCADDCADSLVKTMAQAYVRRITAHHQGDPLEMPSYGRILSSVLDEAVKEGNERKKFKKCTVLDDEGLRRLNFHDKDCPILHPLSPFDDNEVQGLMEQFNAQHDLSMRILDGARRYGQGVSSLAAPRYIVLVDHGMEGSEDDRLLNIRMVVEAPTMPTLASARGVNFRGNRDRIRTATQRLWSREQNDPYFASLSRGNRVFKVHTWTSFFQDVDRVKTHKSLRRELADREDLERLAQWIGLQLADAHARGGVASGGESSRVIAEDLRGRHDRLVFELMEMNRQDRRQLISDHRSFQCLLSSKGTLAGLDQIAPE